MIDIREPKKPMFVGCYADTQTGRAGTGYSHDAQCVTYKGPDKRYKGHEICIGSNETAISLADVTDKTNPKFVSRAGYPNVGYTHQGWFDEDHTLLLRERRARRGPQRHRQDAHADLGSRRISRTRSSSRSTWASRPRPITTCTSRAT